MRSTVLAAVTASLLGPGAAHAGSYQVVSCNAPGADGVNRAWVGGPNAFNRAPEPQNYDVYDDCRGPERGLVARTQVGGSGNAGFLTGARLAPSAPGAWQ